MGCPYQPICWERQVGGRDQEQEQLLHTHIWKGQSNFLLEHFMSQHHNAYVSMSPCAEHVQYQLPNEHSCIGLLIDAIQCAMPDYRPPWPALKQTMVHMACEIILNKLNTLVTIRPSS